MVSDCVDKHFLTIWEAVEILYVFRDNSTEFWIDSEIINIVVRRIKSLSEAHDGRMRQQWGLGISQWLTWSGRMLVHRACGEVIHRILAARSLPEGGGVEWIR